MFSLDFIGSSRQIVFYGWCIWFLASRVLYVSTEETAYSYLHKKRILRIIIFIFLVGVNLYIHTV